MTSFRLFSIIALLSIGVVTATGNNNGTYISTQQESGSFTLSASGISAPLIVSARDFPGVRRVATNLQADVASVTNARPEIFIDSIPSSEIVLIGTLGKNSLIDKLVREKKLDVNGIAGKWETFLIQVIEKPFANVERALVIAGSDKRGTIFGMFDLSEKIGVSPWYWWADVPAKKKSSVYVLPGRYTLGEPKVKYRGIFINDEAPALSGWLTEKYGSELPKHEFYQRVFELILRLKGNFLWPAMWGRAFYDDDPENPRLADEYGVVISTSHHEPMMRAHVEWQRYGKGPWNYEKNDSTLREFWKEGIKRMGSYESVVTLAMRGDGDEAMSPTANVSLLEKIVADQRKILADVTGKDVTTIPQVWALYKEVQEYYDKGMRVPDDVTVLLCDDNWGNIRKLPRLDEKPRRGGYGIYYHFDFVGGPRNYKWLNTTQIERVWEQMHLAYEYNARQIWIVNVGDIKPMEFPISFFLDYAWNPEAIQAGDLPEYTRRWAEEQFGAEYAGEIADLLSKYTKFNSRRKPELLSPNTYSLVNYREAETVVSEYNAIAAKAQRIYDTLPEEYKDAFYQLVLHQPLASANVNEMYVTIGKNLLYAKQGRAATNALAQKAREFFDKDSLISYFYNNVMANGKWSHMMDQTHIGYTYWQQPPFNKMPAVKEIEIPEEAEMGVALEGSENWWSGSDSIEAVLPEFDVYNQQKYYIEIFNRGKASFHYTVKTGKPWIKVSSTKGKIEAEERLWVAIDWKKAPKGTHRIPITISGPNLPYGKAGKKSVTVFAFVNNPSSPKRDELSGFGESNGYVSMEAANYTSAVSSSTVDWLTIPNLGRTGSAVTTTPVTSEVQTLSDKSPRLEYKMHLFTSGEVKVNVYLSPALNYQSNQGLRYAISFDDEQPQVIAFQAADTIPDFRYPQWWNEMVSNNVRIVATRHTITKQSEHILKFWMVDPGVVLQKVVIETGNVKPSYLGPPESAR